MDRFEKATAGMDRVGGWDVETFAQQARALSLVAFLSGGWRFLVLGSGIFTLCYWKKKKHTNLKSLVQKKLVAVVNEFLSCGVLKKLAENAQ